MFELAENIHTVSTYGHKQNTIHKVPSNRGVVKLRAQ
jgi:hypothetical protein